MPGNAGRKFVRSLHISLCFVRAALVYWVQVFPAVAREIRAWRRHARATPDAYLRRVALTVLRTKRGNLEGAAAFAAFAPRRHRVSVIRAQVALQGIYDYVDTLAEHAIHDPIRNSRQLHLAVNRALEPAAPHANYYAWQSSSDDGGYLVTHVEACRTAMAALPSRLLVAATVSRFARRIICYQSCNLSAALRGGDPLKLWADDETPARFDLRWWETAAAAGSSLGIFVLLAVAADPSATLREVQAIEETYFPWIGALHSLLDHLIDFDEDMRDGQRNFMALYDSPREAAARLHMLARESLHCVDRLPNAVPHKLVLAGMVSFYLSVPEAHLPGVELATERVLNAAGGIATVAMLMLRARRVFDRLALPFARRRPKARIVRNRTTPKPDYSGHGLLRKRTSFQAGGSLGISPLMAAKRISERRRDPGVGVAHGTGKRSRQAGGAVARGGPQHGRAGHRLSPGLPPPGENGAPGSPDLAWTLSVLIVRQWVDTLTEEFDWADWPLVR